MLKRRKIFGLAVLGLGLTGYYQYHHNNSFRSLTNLVYAGSRMAIIYKYSQASSQSKNFQAAGLLRDALRSNGGIYIKLGQLIATLDVIVPDEYRTVMSTLTRECKTEDYEDIKRTIEEETGYPINVVFSEFQKQPISSASIAQVHRATLLGGRKVAVKVQHSGLAETVDSDLKLMKVFVDLAKRMFQGFNYDWLVEQFQKNAHIELDFRKEAANMQRAASFLADNNFKSIYVPEVLLQPKKRLLVMQFIQGVHIDQVEAMRAMGVNPKQMGKLFAKMIIKMIHKAGFVHADTHTGNMLVRKYKGKDQLVLLDHGLYQELDANILRNYNRFWLGLILNDPKHYAPAARALGTTNPTMLSAMLTSKTQAELTDQKRPMFGLHPNQRDKVIVQADKNHKKIVSVLSQLRRECLLLLKVNQFARSIENMMGGRQDGVYREIAQQCVQNIGAPWYTRWSYYTRMLLSKYF